MQIPPPNTIKTSKRNFRVFYKWGIEVCNVKYKHNVWLADFLRLNYITVGLKTPFKFKYTKFFYGCHHRNLRIGIVYINWGFYNKIHKKFKYAAKNGKRNNNRGSKKKI